MKSIFTFACLLLLFGCKVQMPTVPSIMFTESVDYARFDDFFLSEANSVSFEYKPIASVSTIHIQGTEGKTISLWTMNEVPEESERTKKKFDDDVYSKSTSKNITKSKSQKVIPVTLEGTLDELVKESKELGANGVINLKIKMVNQYRIENSSSRGYEITGMAIKK